MICKKIPYRKERDASSSVIANVRRMVRYVTQGQVGDLPLLTSAGLPANARVRRVLTFGFVASELAAQTVEMAALASSTLRSPQPVDHWLLSWREGEAPTDEDAADAVEVLLTELGLRGHQVIAAVHVDTANVHVHVLINRVDVLSGLTVKAGGGFDREAAHRAIARIVQVQGWTPETNARYRVDEASNSLIRVGDGAVLRLSSGAAALEVRHGVQSAERIAQLELAPVAAQAGSWAALHQAFAAHGAEYIQQGSGASVVIHAEHPVTGAVQEIPVRASRMGRQFSFSRMIRADRLGPYVPRDADCVITPRPPATVRGQDQAMVLAYHQERHTLRADRDALNAKHAAEIGALRARHRDERAALLVRGAWQGRGRELNAARRELAAQQRRQREGMQLRHEKERAAMSAKAESLVDYETWLRSRVDHEAGERYRYGDALGNRIVVPASSELASDDFDLGDGQREPGWERDRTSNWVDLPERPESVLAALADARSRSDAALNLYGSAEFRDLALRLAAERAIPVGNPELLPAWRLEHSRWQAVARPDRERQVFHETLQRIHAALRADRYLISMDVSQHRERNVVSQILGRADQARAGFTVRQLMAAYPELVDAAKVGVLRCQPLSSRWMYPVADSLVPATVERVLHDELLRPVLHLVDPDGLSQLVFREPCRLAGQQGELNRLIEAYGMSNQGRFGFLLPGLPGADRAVELVHAQDIDCRDAASLQVAVDDTESDSRIVLPGTVDDAVTLRAFQVHRHDVLRRAQRRLAPSVVDVSVVLRLLITDHDEQSVRAALNASIGPERRMRDARDWERYAERTLSYALGKAGEVALRRVAYMREVWMRLETGSAENVLAHADGLAGDEYGAKEKTPDERGRSSIIWTPS